MQSEIPVPGEDVAWGEHPLVHALQEADPELQLSVVYFDGAAGAIICWMNEPHKRKWGNLVGCTCFSAYNEFCSVCSWCPCLPALKSSRSHTALAVSPIDRNASGKGPLEYSQMTAVCLRKLSDTSGFVLEVILSVSAEQTALLGLLKLKADLTSKVFDILSHSYGNTGLGILLFVLAVRQGFGFKHMYLLSSDPASHGDPQTNLHAEVFGPYLGTPETTNMLLNLDSDDRLEVSQFHDEYVEPLRRKIPESEIPPQLAAALTRSLTGSSVSCERIDLKSAVLNVTCHETGLAVAIAVTHGSSSTYLTEDEFAFLSLFGSAAKHSLRLGAMTSAFATVQRMEMNSLKRFGLIRSSDVNFDPNLLEAAKLMGLASIHEFRNSWRDLRTNLQKLDSLLPEEFRGKQDICQLAAQNEQLKVRIDEQLDKLNKLRRLASMDRKVVDVVEVLRSVIAKRKVSSGLKQAGISLSLFPKEGKVFLHGSEEHLEMAFDNLINNAIYFVLGKFPEGRGGHIRVLWSADHQSVQILIVDNGTGVAPGTRHLLFLPFYSTKGEMGMGLGLPIVKLICDYHQGGVELYSRFRKWTKVHVTLPIFEHS